VTNRRRLSFGVPLPLLAVAGVLIPISGTEAAPPAQSAAETAYHALPSRPVGDADRGQAGVERTAIAVAAWLGAVPTAENGAACNPEHLLVSWTAPPAGAKGAFAGTLGPAPTVNTTAVNGLVHCATSDFAYMGFTARYANGRWDVTSVPVLADDEAHRQEVVEAPRPSPVDVASLDGRVFGAAIEAPAAYEPQRTCDATGKVGTVALKNLLLKTYPGSRTLGIGTGCDGSTSEHHEGRAFDWGVRITTASEKAMAESFIQKVLARDQHGNDFALARRMGIMYMIWNRKIWSSYAASDGWRPYSGSSPHTDHIHISMSWAGAQGRTSFWSGNVAQVLAASTPRSGGGTAQLAAAKPRTTATSAPRKQRTTTIDTQLTAEQKAQKQAEYEAWKAERAARLARRNATTTTTEPDDESTTTTSTTWRRRSTTTTSTTVKPTTTTTVKPTTTTVPLTPEQIAARLARRRRTSPTTTTTVKATTTTTVKPTTTTAAPAPTTTAAPPATTTTTQ
jgi:hypothetical protein